MVEVRLGTKVCMGKRKKSVPQEREYYSLPWGMFTKCTKCGEMKFCRGKSRHRVKCRECFFNE